MSKCQYPELLRGFAVVPHWLPDNNNHFTAMYRSISVSQHTNQEVEHSIGTKFNCPHALADGNLHIWDMEKTLVFSSTVIPTPSPHHAQLARSIQFNPYITLC